MGQSTQRLPARFGRGDTPEQRRLVVLGAVEVVDPEFVEVAEDDVFGAVRGELHPVVERLAVVPPEVGPALLHFDQHDRLINQVGERGPPFVALFDPHFQNGPGLAHAF